MGRIFRIIKIFSFPANKNSVKSLLRGVEATKLFDLKGEEKFPLKLRQQTLVQEARA